MKPIIALVAMALPTMAETLVTPEAFEQMTEGRTFYYRLGPNPYGAEEYLPGRRVRWSYLDGKCQEGDWYEELGLICFVYDTDPEPQCWSFQMVDGGLMARFENEADATTLYEMQQSGDPLLCLGPEVGV